MDGAVFPPPPKGFLLACSNPQDSAGSARDPAAGSLEEKL